MDPEESDDERIPAHVACNDTATGGRPDAGCTYVLRKPSLTRVSQPKRAFLKTHHNLKRRCSYPNHPTYLYPLSVRVEQTRDNNYLDVTVDAAASFALRKGGGLAVDIRAGRVDAPKKTFHVHRMKFEPPRFKLLVTSRSSPSTLVQTSLNTLHLQ